MASRIVEDRLGTTDGFIKNSATFSTDGRHVGFVATRDGRSVVVVDGKEGPSYDKVRAPLLGHDGSRVVYAAKKGDMHVVVSNEEEVGAYEAVGSLVLSPDGNRLAFTMLQQSSWQVVVNGVVHAPNDKIERGSLRFSPDGAHVSYLAERDAKWVAIVDGEIISAAYDDIGAGTGIVFSPDSRRIGFVVVSQPTKQFVVLDGQPQKAYAAIGSLVFSNDSRRVAYVAFEDEQAMVVLDGKQGNRYDTVAKGSMVFSADNLRFAHVAGTQDKQLAVIDGVAGSTFDGIRDGSLTFSADGKHVAYSAVRGSHDVVIVDGVVGKKYDGTAALSFLHDGRLVHRAGKRDKQFVVVDGVEGPGYSFVSFPVIDPTGRHIAYIAERAEAMHLIVDGVDVGAFDTFVPGSQLVFDGPRALYGLAIRDDQILRVKVLLPA